MKRRLVPGEKCEQPGCDRLADVIVYDENVPALRAACEEHGDEIVERGKTGVGSPEYNVDCPNCGCHFGVG